MTMVSALAGSGDGRASAVGAPGRTPLTYEGLRARLGRMGEQLAGLGIGPGDAVALVAPNGPDALVATLGIADRAAVAPLNPAFTEAEVRFLLQDLSARVLVLAGEPGGHAASAAREAGIPILRLQPDLAGPAGSFDLELAAGQPRPPASVTRRDSSVAVLLHTSGTTARPKLVGIRREALVRSAHAIAGSLGLDERDVCLNVMPLFHVHGLVGAAFASLAAGAAVWCTPGFNPLRFARWVEEVDPTWYTAVPSMHQAVIARARAAERDGALRDGTRLRFVRSCSSPLPSSVRDGLVERFQVPVVNAYGMTEAAHQVACTPRDAVSGGRDVVRRAEEEARGGGADGGAVRSGDGACPVGVSSGPEVRVIDSSGAWLPAGTRGEIVLRGATVITAYEQPAEANLASFHEGWLRTGDEGVIDSRGIITLTGRLKELINASGEKISPYEVEDALLAHPGVAEAVCFALPHPTRGEAVAAAVVIAPDAGVDERGLQRFVAARLAACKVPEAVLTLPVLPKGPTGKLQRIGLAARLGLTGE